MLKKYREFVFNSILKINSIKQHIINIVKYSKSK